MTEVELFEQIEKFKLDNPKVVEAMDLFEETQNIYLIAMAALNPWAGIYKIICTYNEPTKGMK